MAAYAQKHMSVLMTHLSKLSSKYFSTHYGGRQDRDEVRRSVDAAIRGDMSMVSLTPEISEMANIAAAIRFKHYGVYGEIDAIRPVYDALGIPREEPSAEAAAEAKEEAAEEKDEASSSAAECMLLVYSCLDRLPREKWLETAVRASTWYDAQRPGLAPEISVMAPTTNDDFMDATRLFLRLGGKHGELGGLLAGLCVTLGWEPKGTGYEWCPGASDSSWANIIPRGWHLSNNDDPSFVRCVTPCSVPGCTSPKAAEPEVASELLQQAQLRLKMMENKVRVVKSRYAALGTMEDAYELDRARERMKVARGLVDKIKREEETDSRDAKVADPTSYALAVAEFATYKARETMLANRKKGAPPHVLAADNARFLAAEAAEAAADAADDAAAAAKIAEAAASSPAAAATAAGAPDDGPA